MNNSDSRQHQKNDNQLNSENIDNKMAAALGYDIEKDNAPKILARGRGEIAQKIIEKAEEEKIPIHSDKDIVKVLVNMDIGQEIPPHLYRAMAEILSFIYNLEEDLD